MSAPRPLLIWGLDGAAWSVLERLLAEGRMPRLAKAVEQGSAGTLLSTVPPITVPAWSSFLTGKNPGKHGIYEFLRKISGSYEEEPIDATRRSGATLPRLLSDGGRKVLFANIPTTYPPESVNGAMISGFLTPAGRRDFVLPEGLLDEIEERHGPYDLYLETPLSAAGLSDRALEVLLHDCREMLHYKVAVTRYLVQRLEPDVVAHHVWGTDRIQHELWPVIDAAHPDHDPAVAGRVWPRIADYYEQADEAMGNVLDDLGPETNLIVMSDHGFAGIRWNFELNAWLAAEGYLAFSDQLATRFRRAMWRAGITHENMFRALRPLLRFLLGTRAAAPAQALAAFRMGKSQGLLSLADVDWSRTRAFAKTGMGQIYLNVKGREPEGIVELGAEYNALREEIVERLRGLVDPSTGKQIEGEIYLKDEVYSGPWYDDLPDITYLAMDQGILPANMTGFLSNRVFWRSFGICGNHSRRGVYVASGPDFACGVQPVAPSIMDIAPTALMLQQVPIPNDMDGQPLVDLLTVDARRRLQPTWCNPPPEPSPDTGTDGPAKGLTDAEQEQLKDRLRGLGYI